ASFLLGPIRHTWGRQLTEEDLDENENTCSTCFRAHRSAEHELDGGIGIRAGAADEPGGAYSSFISHRCRRDRCTSELLERQGHPDPDDSPCSGKRECKGVGWGRSRDHRPGWARR